MIDHRLRMLSMIAHHGTVTAAAEALNYTPSTVSHQMKQLSRELRMELLEHHGRRVRLTPAARILLRHAEIMDAQWEQARAELEEQQDEITGDLTLCGFSTAASVMLPPTMKALKQEFPKVVTRTMEADPAECYDLLLAGDADIALVVVTSSTPAPSDPRFSQLHLLDDPLDLMVPHGHRLAGRSAVSLALASDESWIIARPGSTYHQLVVGACAAAGFTPETAHYAEEWETGTALVAEGFGVCLVSRLARWPDHHPVERIPVRGAYAPTRRIAAVTRAGAENRRTIRHALDVLGAEARALGGLRERTVPEGAARAG